MRRGPGGYTVVEVMLVIAISGFLMLSALQIFGSQRGATQFRQTMEDLRSTIQSHVIEVTSGAFPDTSTYTCSVGASGRPVFAAGSGDSQACIFLGKAVLVLPGTSNLYVFPVAGVRNQATTGEPVTTFEAANAEVAIDNANNYLFTDSYTLSSGTISSAKISDAAGSFDAVGFYNSLSNTVTASTSEATSKLLAKAYQNLLSPTNLSPPPSTHVKQCIEGQSPCAPPRDFKQWILCVNDGTRTAALVVDINPSGIKARLDFSPCS